MHALLGGLLKLASWVRAPTALRGLTSVQGTAGLGTSRPTDTPPPWPVASTPEARGLPRPPPRRVHPSTPPQTSRRAQPCHSPRPMSRHTPCLGPAPGRPRPSRTLHVSPITGVCVPQKGDKATHLQGCVPPPECSGDRAEGGPSQRVRASLARAAALTPGQPEGRVPGSWPVPQLTLGTTALAQEDRRPWTD